MTNNSCTNLIRVAVSFSLKQGEKFSYAVGHLAFGYISGRTSARLLKININIPLLLTMSILPDIDLLLRPFIEHRGLTHSVFTAILVFAPVFAIHRKKAVPYFIALIQHSLIGDFIGGNGPQLFWPVTTMSYGATIDMTGPLNSLIESSMFILAIIVMWKTKDWIIFFKPKTLNLILTIPAFTVLLPLVPRIPLSVPIWLVLPHFILATLFSLAILAAIFKLVETGFKSKTV